MRKESLESCVHVLVAVFLGGKGERGKVFYSSGRMLINVLEPKKTPTLGKF